MRINRAGIESASQISDDECQGGGLCPSCRLAVNKDTGRLKWCMGGNDIWRTRIRFMLLIPAVILPIAIIIIALSKSTVIGKLSMRSSSSSSRTTDETTLDSNDNARSARSIIDNRHFIHAIKNDIEQSDVVERILPDAETSFIPVESLISTSTLQRHKRDMSQHRDVLASMEQHKNQKKRAAASSKSQSNQAHSTDLKSQLLQELQVNFSR